MTADPMMNAELGATETGEIRLRFVGAAAFLALELDRVVHPLHGVRGIQNVPPGSLVGMNLGAARDSSPDHWNRLALAANNPWDRAAKSALAGDNDNLALGALAALLTAIGNAIRRPGARAEICAIDLDFARQFVAASDDRAQAFAQLVKQHKSRFRVDVHVPAHS
jgi:hypothetical protein